MLRGLTGAVVISMGAVHVGSPPVSPPTFGNPVPVTIEGYHGDAMEPFISPNGKYLFFNSSNAPGADTDLYYAQRVNRTAFRLRGELTGANSSSPDTLDAVPAMDSRGNFYFVSTRSYPQTLSTIYHATFSKGSVTGVALVPGISKLTPGWANFDVDVSADGQTMYFDDGKFDPYSGQLVGAGLAVARKTPAGFSRLPNSTQLLANVNDPRALVYGADISPDGLDLYFTRAPLPVGSADPSIDVATRPTTTSAFGAPTRLTGLTGFVEAPALSPHGHALYFHKLANGRYAIYRAARS